MKCLKCKEIITTKPFYGLHEECYVAWFELVAPIEFYHLNPRASSAIKPSSSKIQKKDDTFFHGRYLKYSALLGSTPYILKIQETAYPELPLVEFTCNQIATLLDIEVPSYHLINFNDKLTFVTRNFMSDYTGTLHHIYKFLPKGEQHYTCEHIIKAIFESTGKFSDLIKFVEICLFDALVGNNDRHGRNLAIIETATNKKLAPMYDNPSHIGIEPDFLLGSHFNASGSIWTSRSKEPVVRDYLLEFDRLGYSETIAQFSMKISANETKIIELISNTDISQARKKAFLALLSERMEAFTYVK